LQFMNDIERAAPVRPVYTEGSIQISPTDFVMAFLRQIHVILPIFLFVLGIGYIQLKFMSPIYTANLSLLIDSNKNQDPLLQPTIAELIFDNGAIESQIEIIKSDQIAGMVVDALNLDQYPDFNGQALPKISLTDRIRMFIGRAPKETPSVEVEDTNKIAARRSAILSLQNNITVKRVGRTYVLGISVTSNKPEVAIKIGDAIADAYFKDQLNARAEITKRATNWLNERISELKRNAINSEIAVQKFKAEKGIISTGSKTSPEGNILISDQQLLQATSELTAAHTNTAQMEARWNAINDMVFNNRIDGSVAESLNNSVVNGLREKYMAISAYADELRAKLGPDHYQSVALQKEVADYKERLFSELKRIAAAYKSDLEISQAKEKKLAETLDSKLKEKIDSGFNIVALHDLERESDVFTNLYSNFLQRYQDVLQKQSFILSEARVISTATASAIPTAPKTGSILAIFGGIGFVLGTIIGVIRELRRRVFRNADKIWRALGLETIGELPFLASSDPSPISTNPLQKLSLSKLIRRRIRLDNSSFEFSTVLQSTKIEIDIRLKRPDIAQTIGIISALKGEGRTFVARRLSSLYAKMGARVLLIDCNLAQSTLVGQGDENVRGGLIELLNGQAAFEEVCIKEVETGLDILPMRPGSLVLDQIEFLSSKPFHALIKGLETQYNYIIFDLPALEGVAYVRSAYYLFDGYLLVVEWNKSLRSKVRALVTTDDFIYPRIVGVLLNKVRRK
jgi:succinoglycan biosynthesis transport protein ExoP